MNNHLKQFRNDRIWNLRMETDLSVIEIAKIFDMTRMQVYRILRSRCKHWGTPVHASCTICGKEDVTLALDNM